VGRDDELRSQFDELVHPSQQRELTLRRERRLGLVEEVQAVRPESLDDE
jgi:hypothetical protein